VFSNAFGTEPLTIGAAYIALRAQDSTIVARAGKPLLFGGKTSITLPAGAPALSDPVDFTALPFADVAIDVYVPSDTTGSPLTQHTQGPQVSYVSEAGNHAGKEQFPVARTVTSWYFLSQLEVVAPAAVSAVVTLGDSITDGVASTANMNHRWPDELARRLASSRMAVLNLGLGGNRLRTNQTGTSAMARFDRDVTPQSGVTHVIVLEGINDIGFAYDDPTPTVEDLISAHQQLIARAHARGLKIIAGTLTPFGGAFYATPEGEAKRQAINTWIRTCGLYDGVIDFDRAVRDPAQPTRMLLTFDPGDHLHLNDIGYRTLAEAIDLGLLKAGAPRR
jgi:lysophospholipase L1-like esterase